MIHVSKLDAVLLENIIKSAVQTKYAMHIQMEVIMTPTKNCNCIRVNNINEIDIEM